MKPKEIFNLVVRLLGLFFLYLAVRTVPVIFSGPPSQVVFESILTTALYAGVCWWLVGGARPLTQRAYPDARSEKQGSEASGGASAKADA